MLSVNKLVTRIGASVMVCALLGLSACRQEPVIQPGSGSVLEFDICPKALALPDPQRGFQGLRGWVFFNFDFREEYDGMTSEQAAFAVRLNRALAAQGVLLVVVPVPARGGVNPSVLYLNDPKQAAFSPAAIKTYYDAYVGELERSGVAAVNVLAEASAFDAHGGQTFFKRDLHWTPEGANVVAQATARKIRQRLGDSLPKTEQMLTRNPHDQTHSGAFLNNWFYSFCKEFFPPEPVGDYTVSRPQGTSQAAEVVQAGSSFGGAPFDQGFLGVALQSEVANVSVGNGGAFYALESYLGTRAYQDKRPKVLVWEFPGAVGVNGRAQRRLLAGASGICKGDTVTFEETTAARGQAIRLPEAADAATHYLTFSFSDTKVLYFESVLRYRDGTSETLEFYRPDQTAKRNEGRYFTTLTDSATVLQKIELTLPETATGEVTVQVCRAP